MRIGHLLMRAKDWLSAAGERPFRFRWMDVVLWWVMISLVSISFIADHPFLALGIAIAGGVMIGVLCVIGADPP